MKKFDNIITFIILCCFSFIFQAAKSFDISPKEATIKLGNSATFNCSFTNINSKLITWIDPNGVTISSNKSNRFIVKIHETYSLLHIKNTQIQDKGLYVCIYDEMMNNAAKCNLNFKKETKIVNEELIKGDKRMLSCRDSDENDDLVWYFNDQVVPDYLTILEKSAIYITNATKNNIGTYQCKNKISNKTLVQYNIDVYYKPIIFQKSNIMEYISGADVNLKCENDANPKALIQWTKIIKNNTISINNQNSTTLILHKVGPKDENMYNCKVTNKLGTTSIQYKIIIKVPARIINIIGTTVLENTLAKLKCVATGSAPLILKWLMKDGSINFGTNEINTAGSLINTLKFDNIKLSESGSYQCFVHNKHGTDKANVTISVEYPPIIAKSNLIKYIWKNHISSFDCNYKSNPDSKVNWLKKNKIIKNEDIFSIVNKKRKSSIHINGSISEEYLQRLSGDYECSVKNRHGNNTQTYTLLIAEKPDILSNITIQKFQSGVIELTISSTNITGHLKLQKYLVEYRKYNETNEVNKYFNLTFKNQKWKKIEFAPNEKIRLYNFDAKTEYDIRMYAISAAGMGNAVCFRLITNNNYIPSMLGKYRTRTYHSWFNDLTIIISAIIGASFLIGILMLIYIKCFYKNISEKQKSFKNKNSKLRLEDNFNCNNVNQNGKKNEMQNLLIYKNGNIKCNTRKSNGKCETMTHKSLDKINNELKNGANSDKYHTENKLNKNLNNNVILHCNNEYCTLGRQNKIYSNRSNLQIINTDGFKKNRNKDNEEIYSVSKKMGHPVTNHYNSAHQTPIRSFKNTENSYSNITDYVENQDNGYSEIIEGYMSDSETKAFKIKIPSFYQIKNLPT